MNLRAWLLLGTILFQVGAVSVRGQALSVKDTVLANEKKFSDLQVQRKCDEASSLLAEDFQGTGGPSDSKSDFLQSCKSGEIVWHSEQFSNVEFKLHTPTMAVVSYRDDFDCTFRGRPAKGRLLVSSVWLKDGSRWLMHLHTANSDPMVVTERDTLRLLYSDSDDKRDESAQQNTVGETTIAATPPDSLFIDKEKEVWEALKKKDKAADSRLLADDFVGLYDTGFAAKFDHVSQMDDKYSIDSYNVQDAKVLRLSPTMALLLYKATCSGSGEWEQYCSRPDFVSSLWVERDGHWVNLFSQDTQATGGESDDAVLEAIVANEQKIFETLRRNDITAFGNMLPDDLIDVEDDGIHTKAEWLKEFEEQRKGGLLFKDFKMDDLRLVRYGPSAATLVFRETIDGTQNGKPFEWRINSSSGYVDRDGKWMPVLYQDVMAK